MINLPDAVSYLVPIIPTAGKTIQTIGIMCANPSDDPGCQATLIIAPLALLEQWKQEIAVATEEGTFKVLIYHGPTRPKNKKDVQKYDVVITTYHVSCFALP
jgi:SNF2 family DNA or RNA helicase